MDTRKRDNPCIMILESKRLWEGLSFGEEQARSAAERFPSCFEVVVSDGICYKLYHKEGSWWDWKAYINILKMRNRHPYYEKISGALEVFTSLLPK